MNALRSSLFLSLLATAPVIAQQFSASATGQLNAYSGGNFQSWGPAAIPATPVMANAQSMFGLARATASASGSALDLAFLASDGGSASASVTLLLAAPANAGVRVSLQPTQYSALGYMSASALGQTHTHPSGGAIVFDALVPAGGLAIQVQGSLSAMPFSFASFSFTTTWSFPGVTAAGAPTPGCRGDAVAWTQGIPQLGNANFGITCANTHPLIGAVSLIGFGGLAVPVPYDGVDIWLDPAAPIVTLYLPSNANGDVLHALPLPSHSSFVGLTLFSQFVVLEPAGCMPLGLSGSNAVRWTIQP